jgi:hypothetical protein
VLDHISAIVEYDPELEFGFPNRGGPNVRVDPPWRFNHMADLWTTNRWH